MGKSKCRKSKARRERPTGLPSVVDFDEEVEITDFMLQNTTVQFVIEKLQSAVAEDRECAACSIAKLADKPDFVASAIQNNLVKIAAPLLMDSNLSVAHSIAGCLRNLSACGGHTISKAMVDQDVMTPLVALLKRYNSCWTPKKSPEGKIDSTVEIFVEACNLLWSLCESSDVAVSIFNDKDLISILLPCLNVEVFGLHIPLAVAQCLHTVAEDNPAAIKLLSEARVLELLHSLISLKSEPAHVLLRTLAAGIILNVNSGKISNCLPSTATMLLEVIIETLEIQISVDLVKFSEDIESHKIERKNKYRESGVLEQKLAAINETFGKMELLLPAKQIALELLTNFCFNDDSNDWEDVSSSDASEDMIMDVEEASTPIKISLNIPCEIHGLIVSHKLLTKVLDQIVIPPEHVIQKLKQMSQGKDCLKRLRTVRCRALLCVNNMIQGLDIEELGGASELFQLWVHLANLVFKQTDMSDTEQLEASTSSVRAVLEKLAEAQCFDEFSQMNESDLQRLIDICQKAQDSGVKVNVIRCVATLGCLLGNIRQNNSSRLINVIGSFLIHICGTNSDLWVIAEALDAIFDVFAEDHLDAIAKEICLVEKLNHLLPILKGKIKQQRKSLGGHLPIIMTAKTNLLRFIKYKNEQT